ncbi:MAG: choice-of-anchor D domain-containing protein [Bacteroidales bacterium]|nr:choice-of-anchor D domain-containing protein [Bacteroidales bacterium]MCF8403520.1 choice-of-anchor D domain-containing protein [Bacteroidales bacterium]
MKHITLFLSAILFLAFSVQKVSSQNSKETIDTRIDNMKYWTQKAKEGLVPVSPEIPVKPAEYKTSQIKAKSVLTENSTDVPVTNLTNVTESENSIFVDPSNADYVLNSNNSTSWTGSSVGTLYGANYFQSANTGLNWGGSYQGAGGSNSGDPATAISLSGRQYVNFISSSSGQGIAYSDNGSSWSTATVAPNPGSLADKNHMCIDNSPSSPYEGNLYVAWTPFGGVDDAEIVINRSTNDGVSWSSNLNISSAVNAGSHNQGVNVQTGPNGEVYAVWAIYDGWPTDESAYGFAKSVNGGASFASATRIISNVRGIRTTETSKNHRVNSFPSMAVDISGGPNNGNIYVVWANVGVPGTNTGTNISVYMIRSVNGGATWSTPIRVNQNTYTQGKEAYFPWITCDPETGTLSVIFYDDRNTSSASCEVFVANSFDAGNTWEDFVVSDVSFTPSAIPGLAGGYMGDYLAISARGGKVYPCWTDNRGGIYMTYVSPFVTNNLEKPTNLAASLNNTTGQVNLTWNFSSVPGFLYFNVYRDGSLLGTTANTSYTDNLPTYGYYEYTVTAVHVEGESVPAGTNVQWGDAGISVNPASFNVSLPPDASTTEILTISNIGELDLNYSVSTTITSKAGKAYCTASGGCDEYISQVIFNTINNVSGCSGYADYTAISTDVNAGDTYSLTIVNGNVYTADDLGVWIDWNQDDDYEDAGENVVCDIDNSGQGTFSITVPSDATAGTTTMRIRMKWSGSDCGSPCGTTTYGEVEDYSLNVQGWLLVSPTSGTIAAGGSQNLNVDFDATGLAIGVYTADINVSSNDPSQPLLTVPATLTVSSGNPQIVVSPSTLNFGDVQVGLSNTLQFTIQNTGTGTLAGTITTPTGFSVAAAKDNGDNVISFAVNQGVTESYDVTFTPTLAQPYNGNVVIAHNAPGGQNLVAVTGNGLPAPQPDIAINPGSFYVTLSENTAQDEIMQISNNGSATLTYSSSVSYSAKSGWYKPNMKMGYAIKNAEKSQTAELSPAIKMGASVPDAQGDILMQLNVENATGDNQILGCEFDGTYLWFTGGGAAGTNMLYKLDVAGNLVNSYTQGTTSDWGMRDMAFNGTYLFAGDENGFYQINPTNGSSTMLFTSASIGLTCIRALAYNPNNNHFYACNWDTSIIEFDASGNIISSHAAPGLITMYGLAYDESTGNLWIFDRTGTPATSLYEYSLSTNSLTGVSIQVPLLPGLTDQMNGGLFFSPDLVTDKVVLGGLVQGTGFDTFFALELYETSTLSWLNITNNGSGSVPVSGSNNVTLNFDATGLTFGIYTAQVEVSSNDLNDPLVIVPCTLEVSDVSIQCNLKAMLEGPYFNGAMTPWLNIFGYLPLTQPYNVEPWFYAGSESVTAMPSNQVIDWVLVELRETTGDATTATSDKMIARKAGLLLNDGTIINTTDSGPLKFNVTVTDNLFALVWHRNHLGIMSANPVTKTGGVYTYDFTTAVNKVHGGGLAHKQLDAGKWGMISGDGNSNGEVENNDKDEVWVPLRGSTGYYNADFNMNCNVYDEDKEMFWAPNAGKGTKVVDGMPAEGYSSQVPK